MKELTIEEKAKAFDEALSKAKQVYKTPYTAHWDVMKELIEHLFPELTESDDERIRKELLSFCQNRAYNYSNDPKYANIGNWIAWLEKQGVQKPTNNKEDERMKQAILGYLEGSGSEHEIIHGIKIKDAITWLEKQGESIEINPTEFDTKLQALIGKFDSLPKEELIGSLSFWLNVVQNDGTYKPEEKQGEQKSMKTCAEYYNQDNELKMPELSEFQNKLAEILMYREYDGPDETEDDIAKGRLEYELAAIRLSEELLPLAQKEQKPAWSEEDEKTFSYLENIVDFCYRNQFVVDVRTCEKVKQLVFRLKSLRFQSKWSKDDITRINEIIETLNIVQANRVRTQRMHYNKATIDKNIDFLKSLKNRVQPKQEWSEEDKKIINGITSYLCTHDSCELDGFNKWYDWLKSLKERITWKPSDEQMNALWDKISNDNLPNSEKEISQQVALTELYEQLKKLRGE